MPWTETRVMDERGKFVMRAREPGVSVAQASRENGISRKTAYKWLERYEDDGFAGLGDRSRAPKSCPHRMSEHVEQMLVETRLTYSTWGARKVLAYLKRKHPDYLWPSASAVHGALVRAGLVEVRKKSQRAPVSSAPLSHADRSNAVWSVDYKGQFTLGDGRWCYPLTITDNFSRMILCCTGLPSISGETSRKCMELAFERYGLPDAIRSDNGPPFATRGICGLSSLSAWWRSLGIRHERTDPGRPDQNGRHERMHLTLKIDTTRPAAARL